MKNTKVNNEESNIKVVMTKYITGGKEVVKFDSEIGKCWIERIKGGEISIVKEYSQTVTV